MAYIAPRSLEELGRGPELFVTLLRCQNTTNCGRGNWKMEFSYRQVNFL